MGEPHDRLGGMRKRKHIADVLSLPGAKSPGKKLWLRLRRGL